MENINKVDQKGKVIQIGHDVFYMTSGYGAQVTNGTVVGFTKAMVKINVRHHNRFGELVDYQRTVAAKSLIVINELPVVKRIIKEALDEAQRT